MGGGSSCVLGPSDYRFCKLMGKDFPSFTFFVYRANNAVESKTIWSDLLRFENFVSDPWVVLGEF